ncbi:MAG TPA: sigma-70 family RNA polymerase sigma factor [Gaiellaceae bacterium]|nr:sigma-70 family RNA polymerase sigma factor [Gaiellaceae bacterium]
MAADPRRACAEADAAGRLYTRHYQRVYGYCLYKLGNREEAEDAAQTAFLHALRGLRRGVVPVAEANWLLTIAKNVCLAGYRTNGRRRRLEVLSDPQALDEVPVVHEEAGESLLGLEAALARIPEQQRRAILLREWRGLPYREIAEEMGLTLAAVETLIFRARRSLAEILAEERGGPRRRLASVFDLGGLATVAKSLLGGAATVKVAAGVVAVTAALVVGPSAAPGDDLRPASPTVSAPARVVPAAPTATADPPLARSFPARGADQPKPTVRPDRSKRRPAAETEGQPKPRASATAEKAPEPEAPVKTTTTAVGEVVGATTNMVGAVVETASGTVGGVVDTASGTVDGVVEETGLPLPEVGGITDELTDDVDAIADGLLSP